MPPENTKQSKSERRAKRESRWGELSLLVLLVFAMVVGSIPISNDHVAFLKLSMLFLPLSAWFSVRSLQTPQADGKVYAVLALIGIVAILIGHLIELVPLLKNYYLP